MSSLLYRLQPFPVKIRSISRVLGANMESQDEDQFVGVLSGSKMEALERIKSPSVNLLKDLFESSEFELRLCGGAVRDILLGRHPKDLDFATTATPSEMVELFDSRDVRRDINSAGMSHGTVTCRIFEENFEVTTLRVDDVTDGRHAKVSFTKSWKEDASRRDLTINSMFLSLDGKLFDYFDGRSHLEKRLLRFVNDPALRIKEDYLRILRYFRFFGRIADKDTRHDPDILDAIKTHSGGLEIISGERLWQELSQILSGNQAPHLIKKMHECDLLSHLGFPDQINLKRFNEIYEKTLHLSPSVMIYIASLIEDEDEMMKIRKRLRLSNADLSVGLFIIRNRAMDSSGENMMNKYEDILVSSYRKDKNTLQSFFEFIKYSGNIHVMKYFENYQIPKFPINGTLLKKETSLKGRALGEMMNKLFELWQHSRYQLTCEQLLEIYHQELK